MTPEDLMIERLRKIPTATICDAYLRLKLGPADRIVMRRVTALDSYAGSVVGRARTQQMVTVRDPARGSMVADRELHFELVDGAQADDFLVVAVAGHVLLASFGDMLALKAHAQGAAGVVLDGATRDARVIRDLGLPLWCDGVTPIPQGSGGYSVQSVNQTVTCAGVEVFPGDWVVGDDDGVVVVRPDEVERILEIAEELEATEHTAREGVKAGKTLSELYPSRAYYARNDE